MKTFGFVGFGSMANMLIGNLMQYAGVNPREIGVTRKDSTRLEEISARYPGVQVYQTCREVAQNAQVLFVCVKPAEVRQVLTEMEPVLTESTHVISLAGTVSLANLQWILKGKVSKFMPTICSQTGGGISLLCHNSLVGEEDAAFIETTIGSFSKVKRVDDSDIGFAAELTSCAPGFIASMFQHFSQTALHHTSSFGAEEVNDMVMQTLYATGEMLVETGMSFEQAVSRVATKGGITQEGVAVFDNRLPEIFDEMFAKTLGKRKLVEERINRDFRDAQ